jgi:hypothetical protein
VVEYPLREIIENAIEEYNRYMSPEVKAKLISINEKIFEINFTGTFCYTCGFYDYFDDYKILLEENELKTKITEIKEINEGANVTFETIE